MNAASNGMSDSARGDLSVALRRTREELRLQRERADAAEQAELVALQVHNALARAQLAALRDRVAAAERILGLEQASD